MPVNPKITQELEYVSWLAGRVAEIVDIADRRAVEQRDQQVVHTEKLLKKSGGKVLHSHVLFSEKCSYILPNAYINAKVSTGFWYGDSRPPKVMIITIYLKTK